MFFIELTKFNKEKKMTTLCFFYSQNLKLEF